MKKRVTKIEVQKKHPERRSIFLDGDFFCGVNEEVLVRLDLRVGSEVDDEEIGSILLAEEKSKAKEYALNLLSYRMRSKHELARRMMRKRFNRATVDEVIEDLERIGLVDDLEFARSWIRTRMELNPRSFYALERELRLKGIDEDVYRIALKELKGEYDEKAIALSLGRRQMDKLQGRSPAEVRRRVIGFLSRRGFSYGVARWAISELEEGRHDVE
jgi:regulatory protein